jgi:hypothetical protein
MYYILANVDCSCTIFNEACDKLNENCPENDVFGVVILVELSKNAFDEMINKF